jgi:hypothetical protein
LTGRFIALWIFLIPFIIGKSTQQRQFISTKTLITVCIKQLFQNRQPAFLLSL